MVDKVINYFNGDLSKAKKAFGGLTQADFFTALAIAAPESCAETWNKMIESNKLHEGFGSKRYTLIDYALYPNDLIVNTRVRIGPKTLNDIEKAFGYILETRFFKK